jgi:hypothetical protein
MCKHPTCKDGICRREKKEKKPYKIKPRSKKMDKQMKEYNQKREAFLRANPICVVTGEKATEIHHSAGRIGKMLLDETYWKPVSRKGHIHIEENPDWAKERGYSISRLSKRA